MTMLLAAEDAGLGALFFGIFRGERQLRRALGIPAVMQVLGALAIGYAAPRRPDATGRRGRRHGRVRLGSLGAAPSPDARRDHPPRRVAQHVGAGHDLIPARQSARAEAAVHGPPGRHGLAPRRRSVRPCGVPTRMPCGARASPDRGATPSDVASRGRDAAGRWPSAPGSRHRRGRDGGVGLGGPWSRTDRAGFPTGGGAALVDRRSPGSRSGSSRAATTWSCSPTRPWHPGRRARRRRRQAPLGGPPAQGVRRRPAGRRAGGPRRRPPAGRLGGPRGARRGRRQPAVVRGARRRPRRDGRQLRHRRSSAWHRERRRPRAARRRHGSRSSPR